jgi:hypothetical protein
VRRRAERGRLLGYPNFARYAPGTLFSVGDADAGQDEVDLTAIETEYAASSSSSCART